MSCRLKRLLDWVDARLPFRSFFKHHLSHYYAPKNLNFWYFFGSLGLFVLVNQVITGIWLTMNYKPDATLAFDSIEYMTRDVDWGWLIRYLHTTGASAFFIVLYLHMFRGLIYGSYKNPREMVWVIGMMLFGLLMAEAFMGYLLPWGQMSYWGAQVIISLIGAIPGIGEDLALWVRGDYVVSDATLNRFFALHVIAIPLLIIGLVLFHIIALHKVGSNNPDGIEIKAQLGSQGVPLDGIPFHPYYTIKDLWGLCVFLFVFSVVVFFAPEGGGYFLEAPNFEPANPLKTPEHIAPVWYFTPFYSILRSVPDKAAGVFAMGAAVAFLFILPWLDKSPVRSIRYRGPLFKRAITFFVISFLGLAYLGTQPVTPAATLIARVFTVMYFSFFVWMPVYTRRDLVKPVPARVP